MKTAMQEWFDELKANYPYMANQIYQKGFEKYLEKEKEQIIEGHFAGWSDAYDYLKSDGNNRARQAEEYYDETYNQNK